MKTVTVITGATGGLGGAFAKACAKRGENLILTGRSLEKLTDLKNRLTAEFSGLEIETLACSMSDEHSRYALIERMQGSDIKIGKLINVAGADIQKSVESYR